MSDNTKQLISVYELLPTADQNMILELSKKLLLAYDPDYTKVLPFHNPNSFYGQPA